MIKHLNSLSFILNFLPAFSIRLTSCMDYNGITLFIGAAALAINYTLFRCDPGRLNVYLPIVVVLASVREWWVACIFLEGNRGGGLLVGARKGSLAQQASQQFNRSSRPFLFLFGPRTTRQWVWYHPPRPLVPPPTDPIERRPLSCSPYKRSFPR